ncbi:MAG: hypothetical protein LQ337_004194 [Flavoplaca oasis]|nr:MAG: hypothetical protein LQ337_004194 [Flavoplaca oasis]
MAPASSQHQISSGPTVLIPIETRRETPSSREQHQILKANGHSNSQSNGALTPRRARRPKLLSVDEALQYSPFSSIVPFNTVDQRAAREPLELLDADIARTQGRSAMAQHALGAIKGYLEGSDLTDL